MHLDKVPLLESLFYVSANSSLDPQKVTRSVFFLYARLAFGYAKADMQGPVWRGTESVCTY